MSLCRNCNQNTYHPNGFCSDECHDEYADFMAGEQACPPEDTPSFDGEAYADDYYPEDVRNDQYADADMGIFDDYDYCDSEPDYGDDYPW